MVVSNNGLPPGHVVAAAVALLLASTHKGGCQALAPTSGVAQSSGVLAAPLQRAVWLAALAGAAGAFGLP